MKWARWIVFILILAMPGCLTNRAQQGAAGGAAGGAILGQILGKDTKGTVLGAAIGGALGYVVGNEMDKADRDRLTQAYEYTPDNQKSQWQNPNTRNQYEVTPVRTYKDRTTGLDCREAEIMTTIDGKAEKVYTTACRENGKWVVQ